MQKHRRLHDAYRYQIAWLPMTRHDVRAPRIPFSANDVYLNVHLIVKGICATGSQPVHIGGLQGNLDGSDKRETCGLPGAMVFHDQ